MAHDILSTEERPPRAIVAAVQLAHVADEEFQSSLAELSQLAKTLGVAVLATVTQKRGHFDPGGYLGPGKREELGKLVAEARGVPWVSLKDREEEKKKKRQRKDAAAGGGDADVDDDEEDDEGEATPNDATRGKVVILVDHEISPSQARNLEKEMGADVLDRTAVILEIFHRHARSRAARAQVEIVRLQYLAPRLRETGKGKDRQRGGIGGKGAGESNLELDRRKIRDRIAELTAELSSLEQERTTQRARRRDVPRVALVGYTNAGKSTLMRALTGSEVYVADKLFATLDTTVRTLHPETVPRVLVSDTVGFIKNLPHGLVASFKSTLDEAHEASLLAHVVDASDAGWERQLEVTETVLGEIGANDVPRLLVFNKVDRVGDDAAQAEAECGFLARWPDALVLSAKRPDDVARLRQALVDFFGRDLVEEELHVGYDRQQLRGEIFAHCQVLGERYDETGVVFRLRATAPVLERLRGLVG